MEDRPRTRKRPTVWHGCSKPRKRWWPACWQPWWRNRAVLVEGAGRTPGTLNGRLDNNLVVEFQADESLIGRFAEVKITAARAALLLGERV